MSPARALRLAVVLWGVYLRADDWMRPAISHGAVIASVVSGALLAWGSRRWFWRRVMSGG